MLTTTRSQNYRGQPADAPYLGWSHRNSRPEMMDLSGYLDSLRQGYDSVREAYGSMFTAIAGLSQPGQSSAPRRPGANRSGCGCDDVHRHGHDRRCCGCGDEHEHGHNQSGCGCSDEHDHEHDHGHDRRSCGSEPSCRCQCCIEDADIVVYAHCGELRVVPIEIDNDTRKVREDVSLEISDVRTAGGRQLRWRVVATTEGPLTLDACSTTKIEILVHVVCDDDGDDAQAQGQKAEEQKAQSQKAEGQATENQQDQTQFLELTLGARLGAHAMDVDECVVGYFTVRLGGCLTRPIVVAIAALPAACDSYRTGCACCC